MRTFIHSCASAIALAVMLTALSADKQPVDMTDKEFIRAVRDVAEGGATPDNVEARLRTSAIINTKKRPGDLEKLRFATVELDSEQQSDVSSLEGQDIAYWGRPGTFANPHVVGIAWLPKEKGKVFFAVVYPPR